MSIASKLICGVLVALTMPGSAAAAVYHSSSDTGTEILDYIENRHREERANRLSEEQEKLIQDAKTMEATLRQPLDPEQPFPVAFEGEDLTYDESTGEFKAVGNVDIIQMDGHRFQGEEVNGNIEEHVIRVPDKAHMLQLAPNAPRVTLDGYNAVYNYADKTGSMENGKGKAGEYYITGKRFEFYPDRIVVYNGTQTKCGAQKPDYHLSAEKLEIWPKQLIKMYNVKLWAGDMVVASMKYHESDLTEGENNDFPKVGYNKEHGAYIEQDFKYYFTDKLFARLHAHVETKHGFRSYGDVQYNDNGFKAQAVYGYFEDKDNVWIQKKPGLILDYSQHFGKTPYGYDLKGEVGRWKSATTTSTHQYYEADLWRDPIVFHKWLLFLRAGYSVTKESADNSTVRGMKGDVILGKDFDDKWAGFVGYHYTKNNTKNSLFLYGVDDYSKKFDAGLSYRMDDLNRFVVGVKYDLDSKSIKDVDYYWYRDLHCSQVIMRYRAKRNKFEVRWQFTPW